MITPIWHGIVEKDVIVLDLKDRFREHRKSLEGERIDLILRKHEDLRTAQQNKFYHKIVVEILSEHTGYTHDEMHENLKRMFLSATDGHGLIRVGSTAKLKTKEFTEYIDKIMRWAAIELRCPIPEPNSVDIS